MRVSQDEDPKVLYVVSYQVPLNIVEALEEVRKHMELRHPGFVVKILTRIGITRFISEKRNRSEIGPIVENAASEFLPLSIPLSFGFDVNRLSVTNPHVSLGTSDRAGLKLLRLEEAILEKVKPFIHIPEEMPEGVHPKQQEYFRQYGQTDILRWHSGEYTVVSFPDYDEAKDIVSELADKFRPVESRVEIAELLVDLVSL